MRLLSLAIFAAIFSGCTSTKAHAPETVPTGNAIARADAHVTSADNSVKAAKPHPDSTGKALLDQATKSHIDAKSELEKAEESNKTATKQIGELQTKERLANEARDDLAGKWYVTTGRWIEWAFWGLITLGALHIILRLAGLFISGPVGAALAMAGTIINPFGWFQALCDNLFFRRKLAATQSIVGS